MRVLFVLQNAWRRGARDGERDWNDRVWDRLLWRSQTGKRLREMIPNGIEYKVINASPFVGNHSKSRFQADLEHVWHHCIIYRPQVVVLLGKEARELRTDLPGPRIVVGPHPAWRLLSKENTAQISSEITGKAMGE